MARTRRSSRTDKAKAKTWHKTRGRTAGAQKARKDGGAARSPEECSLDFIRDDWDDWYDRLLDRLMAEAEEDYGFDYGFDYGGEQEWEEDWTDWEEDRDPRGPMTGPSENAESVPCCTICDDDTHALVYTGCGRGNHHFCTGCLGTWVDSKLDSGCIVIGCPEPGCNHPLTFRALERISGEQRFGRFLSLAVQDYKGKADGIMADPALSVWAKENTKQCPVCWQLVERSAGCNHISCQCGATWCYCCCAVLSECRDRCGLFDEAFEAVPRYAPWSEEAPGITLADFAVANWLVWEILGPGYVVMETPYTTFVIPDDVATPRRPAQLLETESVFEAPGAAEPPAHHSTRVDVEHRVSLNARALGGASLADDFGVAAANHVDHETPAAAVAFTEALGELELVGRHRTDRMDLGVDHRLLAVPAI